MTKWKPARKAPMLSNGPRVQMGQAQVAVPIIATVARWLIPWLAVSGGMALTSYTASKALPEVPINKKNIALSSALVGAGTVAYFVSEKLADGYKPIAYAASVAGIAAGLYFLFQETPKPDIIPSKNVSPSEVVPDYSPADLQQAFTIHVDPNQKNTGGQRRWPDDQEYEVLVKNETNRPVTFFTGLELYKEGSSRLYRSAGPQDPTYGRKRVSLAPAGSPGNDAVVKLTVPYEVNGQTIPPMYSGLTVDFEFFRQGEDRDSFKVSEAIPVSYGFVPIG